MKKKILAGILTWFCCTAIFAQQKIELKIATVAPARSPWEIELKKMAQEWNKITGGLVSVKFYDTYVLGGDKSVIQKMKPSRPGQRPQIDGAVFNTVGLNELAPKAQIFTLAIPFLIQNQKELDLVLEKHGSFFENEIQKSGCKLLTWSNAGWLSFYTKDSYSSLGDLKKIKLVCSNDTKDFSDVLKVCGFNVDPVPPSKWIQNLKSSTGARGFTAVHLLTHVLGLYKDISYILDARLCPVMSGFVITEESWKLIPDKYKPEMLAALEKTRKSLNEALDKMDSDYLSKMLAAGVKKIELSDKEKSEWTNEFHKDAEAVHKALPNVINIEIYKKIKQLLEPYRK